MAIRRTISVINPMSNQSSRRYHMDCWWCRGTIIAAFADDSYDGVVWGFIGTTDPWLASFHPRCWRRMEIQSAITWRCGKLTS